MFGNSYQLIIARDTATGFAKVGWATDMPQGRYKHLKIVLESDTCMPIIDGSPFSEQYSSACQYVRSLNTSLLAKQNSDSLARGYYSVPLNLNASDLEVEPDDFGSFQLSAMHTLYRLTANHVHVWAVIKEECVVQIQSCHPPKPMQQLEYQIWYHSTLKSLSHYNGSIHKGKLVVQESGLWFALDSTVSV